MLMKRHGLTSVDDILECGSGLEVFRLKDWSMLHCLFIIILHSGLYITTISVLTKNSYFNKKLTWNELTSPNIRSYLETNSKISKDSLLIEWMILALAFSSFFVTDGVREEYIPKMDDCNFTLLLLLVLLRNYALLLKNFMVI